jgi:hypothetical protein
MSARKHSWFQSINAALLASAAIFLIFFCLRGPLFCAKTPALREEKLKGRDDDDLKRKLLLANDYILDQERLARDFHVFVLVACGVVVIASTANLALARQKAPNEVEDT